MLIIRRFQVRLRGTHPRPRCREEACWRWTYHLFRGVVAVCVLYVAGFQIIERASRDAALPSPAPPPVAKAPPPAPVAEVPRAPPPPPAAEPPPAAAASPPSLPAEVVQAPLRPAFRVLGGVKRISQPTTNAVEREMSRKLAMQEYSVQLPYPNRARSTPRVCRPKVWRARACHATHSVRVVRLH